MTFPEVLPVFTAFILSVILCPVLIPLLKRLKFGQNIRQEGNPEHLKKQGTPTMGGIAFLLAILVTGLFFMKREPKILPVMLLTLGFGLIGFTDDYLKVVKKQSEGFKPWQKMLCQILITGLFCVYCLKSPEIGTGVILPFTGGKIWDMGWLYVPFVFLVVIGTDNGTNFTDGLDGLAASVTVVVALFFMFESAEKGGGVTTLSGAVAGALMGYLLFNAHPAKVFMGDTGSLAIGGFVAGAALTLKMGWFVILIGLVYLVEVISVIIQVAYFKLTHGKRFFKMAPIHHHFELCGWSETQIVTLFTCVTVLLGFIAYLAG